MSIQTVRLGAIVVAVLALSGCQKAAEMATQKAVEKSMEAQMKQGGAADAKVDLSSGTIKASTVDKDGKTQSFEMGNAQVSEADFGVPFYPGATVVKQSAARMVAGNESTAMVPLETRDASDKVAAFYRDRMKAMSTGKQFIDMAQGDGGYVMMLNDDANGEAIQVAITAGKAGEPSTVTLTTHRKKRG